MSNATLKGRSRGQTAWRIAQDIPMAVTSIWVWRPELVANYLPEDREVIFHNGILEWVHAQRQRNRLGTD